MYLFSNILGVFVFDVEFKLIDSLEFNGLADYQNKEALIGKIKNKHKNLKEPDEEALKIILSHFRDKKYHSRFREINLAITKLGVKNSVNEDNLVIQSIKLIDELDKSINLLAKRLREWYGLYNPEFSSSVHDHEKFVGEILDSSKGELLKKINVGLKDSMGADFEQENLEPVKSLAHQVHDLYELRKSNLGYISSIMDVYCPNIKAVCGTLLAAKLIEHAGSLKRLSEMPASTIQILGAEKALFRHMKTGAKSPKHGLIIGHSLMAAVPIHLHGKLARALADKISISAKIDYFQGQFIGDKLRKELEDKFK